MENQQFNSLTESLIKSGIIKAADEEDFNSLYNLELDMSKSPFAKCVEVIDEPDELDNQYKKRINNYDMELLNDNLSKNPIKRNVDSFKLLKRFLDFKQSLASRGQLGFMEKFLFTFFPRIYKAKLIKEAMAKFNELNIDTKTLLDKTIPYGESENRYQDLIKYLNCANEIQTKFKRGV